MKVFGANTRSVRIGFLLAGIAVCALPMRSQAPDVNANQGALPQATPHTDPPAGQPAGNVPQAAASGQAGVEPGSSAAAAKSASSLTNTLPPLPTTLWSETGKAVTEIRFEGVKLSATEKLATELEQKAGTPLDPEKVRDDLRRLFASGRYRDLGVSAAPAGNGIALIYTGIPRFYVGRVEIDGIGQERLASLEEFATKLEPGTAYTETQIPAAVESIRESLAENGYFEPEVEVKTSTDPIGHQVNAAFSIDLGAQARVGKVTVAGKDPGISVVEFRKKGDLNCSRLVLLVDKGCIPKVSRETTSTALSGVRGFYEKEDRLEGTISLQKQTYAASRKQLDFDFSADQGPLVKIVINGAKISKSRQKLLVPVYEEGTVDIDLLNEGAFNIRDYLQQQGYFDATDSVKRMGQGTGSETVEYDVKEGIRHRVTSVTIEGNKYFDTDTISERLRVKKGDLYQRSGVYSTQLVASDVASIEALYEASGFEHVKVTSSVKDMDKGNNGQTLKIPTIRVIFSIVEGQQQKFGAVAMTGVDPSREATIRGLLSAQVGQPFSLVTLSADRDSVLGWYVSHGFDHARIEYAQNVESGDAAKTDVTLEITEGHQVHIDHVLLSGIEHTKVALVEHQLLVHAGDPLDQAALLQTQRNLYNLALFNEVNAAVQNPTGRAPDKNVLVQITEAKRWDVTYGFGFEAQTGTPNFGPGLGTTGKGTTAAQNGSAGISPRVSLDVSRINLFGTQKSLTLHTTYGLLETVATLSLNNPEFLGHPNLTAAVSGGYSNVQNITTFQASTLQGDFRVTQKYKKADTFIYDFQYRRISVNENSLEITPNLVSQFSEPVTVGGPQITYFHDTRDPSPLDAGRGMFFSASEFLSYHIFGAEQDFSRSDFTYSSYYTFGKHKYVFARNTRIAFENYYGGPSAVRDLAQIGEAPNCSATPTTAGDPHSSLLYRNATCNPIPLPERIYAGGATSHRGFGINEAGPRDLTTGYPVGGSSAVINNLELRLPPPTLPLVGNSVSFVIFEDMGNVFRYNSDMFRSIKNFHQPNQQSCKNFTVPANPSAPGPGQADPSNPTFYANFAGDCNFNYYSQAVGLGARYKTPVGPIRVDFSYNLNPTYYPVYTDYTTHAPYSANSGHFNFFFSIGQAF